jgi:hypothetical protein
VYKNALPEEVADVRMTALMICGRTGIDAFFMAMTHGEDWAPFAFSSVSAGSEEEMHTPMINEPKT